MYIQYTCEPVRNTLCLYLILKSQLEPNCSNCDFNVELRIIHNIISRVRKFDSVYIRFLGSSARFLIIRTNEEFSSWLVIILGMQFALCVWGEEIFLLWAAFQLRFTCIWLIIIVSSSGVIGRKLFVKWN